MATLPLAAEHRGDLVHLWAAGRLAVEAPAQLYAPAAQRLLLAAEGQSELWMPRNEQLGLFFYPPPAALLYAPLGALPLPAATLAMALANLALAGLGALGLRRLSPSLGWTGGIALLMLFPGVFFNHVLGQNGLLSAVIALWGLLWIEEGRPRMGGALLGLLLFKPQWLLLALIPLVRGRIGALTALAASSLALAGLSALWPGGWVSWLERLPGLGALPELPDYPLAHQYNLAALWRRWLPAELVRPAELLGGLALAAVVLPALRRAPAPQALGLGLAFISLVNPHLHHYDLIAALPALAVLLTGPWSWPWRALALLLHHGGLALAEAGGPPLPPLTLLVFIAILRLRSRPS